MTMCNILSSFQRRRKFSTNFAISKSIHFDRKHRPNEITFRSKEKKVSVAAASPCDVNVSREFVYAHQKKSFRNLHDMYSIGVLTVCEEKADRKCKETMEQITSEMDE